DRVEDAKDDLEQGDAPDDERHAEHDRRNRRPEGHQRREERIAVGELEEIAEIVPGIATALDRPPDCLDPVDGSRHQEERAGRPARRDPRRSTIPETPELLDRSCEPASQDRRLPRGFSHRAEATEAGGKATHLLLVSHASPTLSSSGCARAVQHLPNLTFAGSRREASTERPR